MKESIGATWIFAICLTFIILFTAYIALSVNYSKSFRIKSHIVSEIEENLGFDAELRNNISTYLISQGYSTYGKCDRTITSENGKVSTDWKLLNDGEINRIDSTGESMACIYKMTVNTGNDEIEIENRSYYRVTVFFNFDLPIVNVLLPNIKISGETQYIFEE